MHAKEITKKNPTLLKELSIPKAGDIIEGIIIEKTPSQIFVDISPLRTGVIYKRDFEEAGPIVKSFKIGDAISARLLQIENEDGHAELSLKDVGREKTWEKLEALKSQDEEISCKVVDANKGGLLIELFGIRGFLPVSQLKAENYPKVEGGDKSEILKRLQGFVGKEIKTKILSLDEKEHKIVVSEKATRKKDIETQIALFAEGEIISGKITKVTDFGVFVELTPEIEGMITKADLPEGKDLKEGENVSVKIARKEGIRIYLQITG